MTIRKRWQDDAAFVAWIVGEGYAVRDDAGALTHQFKGDGVVLYMHEAWSAARDAAIGVVDRAIAERGGDDDRDSLLEKCGMMLAADRLRAAATVKP